MSTEYYNLPTVDPAAAFKPSEDINALADKIDHVLQHVEQVGADSHYVLPVATKQSLGGVIAGDNVEIAKDGTISVNVNPYTLPPASYTKLGGVIVDLGGGFLLDPDGTLHIDDSTIGVPDNSVTEAKLQANCVSTVKIQDEAVTYEKLGATLQNYVTQGEEALAGKATEIAVDASAQSSAIRSADLKLAQFLAFFSLTGTAKLAADGSEKSWKLFNTSSDVGFGASLIGNGYGNVLAVSGETAYAGTLYISNSYQGYDITEINFGGTLPAGTYDLTFNCLLIKSA